MCLSITPQSIVATREHKKKGRRSTSSEILSPEGATSPAKSPAVEVFIIGAQDIFSAVARKRKMLLMVQPDPPAPAVCYVLKFGREKACKHAATACAQLAGHIAYERPTTAATKGKGKPTAKPTKRVRKTKRGRGTSDTGSKRDSTASTASVASPEHGDGGGAPLDAGSPASTPASGTKPRRGKLVRGGNAIHTPMLPEFTEALDAITALDSFLDESAAAEGVAGADDSDEVSMCWVL